MYNLLGDETHHLFNQRKEGLNIPKERKTSEGDGMTCEQKKKKGGESQTGIVRGKSSHKRRSIARTPD